MTVQQAAILMLLVATLAAFASNRWRHDVVAAASLMTSVLLGLVPPDVAFAGFGSPAVITVAALLVVRGEVERSGVIDALAGRWLGRSAEPLAHLALLTVLGALLSAFMNNVAALALLLPIALTTARRHGYGPGFLLMPLSFATLLGGMVTLIGTPPNLLVSTFRAEAVGARFELFDFAPMGLVLTAAGTTYLILFGHRFLRRESPSASGGRFRVRDYVTELEIGAGSPLIGRQVEHYEIERDLRVSGIVRDGRRVFGHLGETVTVGNHARAAEQNREQEYPDDRGQVLKELPAGPAFQRKEEHRNQHQDRQQGIGMADQGGWSFHPGIVRKDSRAVR
jgi:di/tricarboxylate transporter